jgi:predicted transglutaminase-like cysteine proteinase
MSLVVAGTSTMRRWIAARGTSRSLMIALSLLISATVTGEVPAGPKIRTEALLPDPSASLAVQPTVQVEPAVQPAVQTAVQPLTPSPVQPLVATPLRFFTINEVLAARNGRSDAETARTVAARTETVAIAPTARLPQGDAPFGLHTFRAPEGTLWAKWRTVQQAILAEAQIVAQCRAEPANCASPAARRFIAIVDDLRAHDGRARIELANRTINESIRYVTDLVQHGVPDLWLSPLAVLASGQGDCEDYAIAKYVALREAGVAADDLELLLVRDQAVRQDHAVLAVRHEGRWLVLDNRHPALLETAKLTHFTPLYVLDEAGVKIFAAPYAARSRKETEITMVPGTETGDAASNWDLRTAPYLQ